MHLTKCRALAAVGVHTPQFAVLTRSENFAFGVLGNFEQRWAVRGDLLAFRRISDRDNPNVGNCGGHDCGELCSVMRSVEIRAVVREIVGESARFTCWEGDRPQLRAVITWLVVGN